MKMVLYFYADHCGLCRVMKRSLVAPLRERGVNVCEIDVMSDKCTAMRYGIKKLPTTIVLDGDEVYSRYEGFADLQMVSNQAQNCGSIKLTGTFEGGRSVNKLA